MRYRLRTLLIVLVALSVAMAITRENVVEFQQAFGSHPAELLGVFARYQVVWGVAFCTSVVAAIFSHCNPGITPAVVFFCVLSAFGLVANLLLPFGMM